MSEVTAKNFAAYLKTTEKQDGTVADRVQAMIEFGLTHYKASGDSRYLASVMNGNFKASRRDGFRAYIVAHSNLRVQKVDPTDVNSALKFTVDPKSPNKTRIIDLPVDKDSGEVITWYQFTKEVILLPFDIDQAVKALINRATQAIAGKDGKKLKGSKKHAQEQLHALQQLVA